MQVKISKDNTVSLVGQDDLKKFSIVEDTPGTAAGALGDIAEPAEENHFWLSAEAIIEMSGRSDDAQWVEGFWGMLKKVEPYGFSDLQNKRVKAHVE